MSFETLASICSALLLFVSSLVIAIALSPKASGAPVGMGNMRLALWIALSTNIGIIALLITIVLNG